MGKKVRKVAGALASAAGAVVAIFNPAVGFGLMAAGGALYATGNQPPDQGEDSRGTPTQRDQGHLINTRTASRPLPLIYGVNTVGVNVTFIHNDNPYLYMICEIGEGELDGIFRKSGEVYSDTGQKLPVGNPPLVYFDDILWTDYARADLDTVYMEFYSGTSDQVAPSDLKNALPGYEENLRYTAYLYVRLKFKKKIYKSRPLITLKVSGLKVQQLVGSDYVYSSSPAYVAQDLLIRPSYRGGLELDKSRLNTQSFVDLHNHTIINKPSNMEANINSHLLHGTNISHSEVIKKVLDVVPAELIYSYDEIKVMFLNINYEPVVMNFSEDDVVFENSEYQISYGGAIDHSSTPNAIKAYYTDPTTGKTTSSTFASDAVQNQDYRETTLNLFACRDPGWVQILSFYYLEKAQLSRNLNVTLGQRAFPLEPLDLFTLTFPNLGFDAKIFRVERVSRQNNGTVVIAAINEKYDYYNETYQVTESAFDETNIVDVNEPPPSVTNLREYEDLPDYRLRSFTRWIVDFSPPSEDVYPFWDYAEVWLRLGDALFINDFNDGLLPDNIFVGDMTYELINQVLRVTVLNGAPDPYVSLWRAGLGSFDPTTYTKLRFQIRYVSGTYDPSQDWDGRVYYDNAAGTLSGFALSSVFPDVDGNWVTIDIDMQADYSSGTKWLDMGDVDYIKLNLFVNNYPSAGSATFEIDNISLGNQFLTSNWKYITRSEGNYILENVIEGNKYYLRFVSVNIWGTNENFDKATTIGRTVKGVEGQTPGFWESFAYSASGQDLFFVGTWRGLKDVVGFEMRRGGINFNDGYPISTARSSSGRVAMRLLDAIANDTQGSFNYHVAPYNNAGVYGEAATAPVDTLGADENIWTPETLVTFDYSTGTHVGTERYDNVGTWCLRVDKTGGNLSGYWVSPIFQFSNQARHRLVSFNFRSAILTSTYTFGSVWGTTKTFGDVDPDRNKRFIDLFSNLFQPTVRGVCDWGTSSPPSDGTYNFCHINMFEANARYYQITIYLQDPIIDYYQMMEQLEVEAWRSTL